MKLNHIATRFNYWILLALVIIMPFYLYYYYNYTSQLTYKKNYYLIQDGNYEYIKKIDLQKTPIINDGSIKDFIKESIVGIFNYRPNVAIRNLGEYEKYFSSAAYEFFYHGFAARINSEIESGVVINEAVVLTDPLLIGGYEYYSGEKTYIYYVVIREMKTGETGSKILQNSEVLVEIVKEDFILNGKGLSIKNISLL